MEAVILSTASFLSSLVTTPSPLQPLCSYKEPTSVELFPYWIPIEDKLDLNDDEDEIYLNGTKDIEMKLCDGSKGPLVSDSFYSACNRSGMCKLDDESRGLFDLDEDKDCYQELDRIKYSWGKSPENNPYSLFISIAARGVVLGTTLEVKELIGLEMPGNSKLTHNGCVRVDDDCKECEPGCTELVLNVGSYEFHNQIHWPVNVTVVEKECEILTYVSTST